MTPSCLTGNIVRMWVLLVKMKSSGSREDLGYYGEIVSF